MYKFLILFLPTMLLVFSNNASAYDYDFMYEGNAYRITSSDWNTLELVKGNYTNPNVQYDEITYNGVCYRVTSIGEDAYSNCQNLQSFYVSKYVTAIKKRAFSGCGNLFHLEFDANSCVKTISENAFNYCSKLEDILFPNSLEEIGYSAFAHCGFKQLTLPGSLVSIGDYAFSSCHQLTWAPIPENVNKIGLAPFFDCENMKYISTNINNSHYTTLTDGSLFEEQTKTLVEYPSGASASNYIIPEEVEAIADAAFYGCSNLESVTIPSSVKRIGNNLTFSWMDKLGTVTTYSKVPFASWLFPGNGQNIKLVVPFGTKGLYGTGWKEIEEMSPLTLEVIQADVKQMKLLADYDHSYSFVVEAEEGWSVHSISYNEEDVTSQLTEQNIYTTPLITESSVLSVVFVKDDDLTTIASQKSTDIRVFAKGNEVFVHGLASNDVMQVYSYDGRLLSSLKGENTICLPCSNVYILKCKNRTFKLKL